VTTAPYRVDERHTIRYTLPGNTPAPVGDLTAALADAQRDYCARNRCAPDRLPHDWAQVRVQDGHIVITFTVGAAPRVVDSNAATQIMPRVLG